MSRKKRSPEAERVFHQLIVREGLSYADAIRRCEQEAKRLSAPYREVADELSQWFADRRESA